MKKPRAIRGAGATRCEFCPEDSASAGQTAADSELHSRTRQRFDSYHVQSPSGCWLWQGIINWGGYGVFQLQGKQRSAHRISWTLYRGTIPKDSFVLHRCDVRNCVNPDHLFLGSQSDNMRDMVSKGRAKGTFEKGERSRRAKLTDAQVAEVRADTGSQKALALRLGVSEQLISDLKLMKRRVG